MYQIKVINILKVGARDAIPSKKPISTFDTNWISPYRSGFYPPRKIIKNGKLVPSLAIKGGKAENIDEKIKFTWDQINVTGKGTVFSIFLHVLLC